MTPPKPGRVKVSKRIVNYRLSKPNGPMCGSCTYFDKTNHTCSIVAGTIRAGDLCDRYKAMS